MIKAKQAFAMVVAAALLSNVFILSACNPREDGETDEYAITLNYNDKVSRPRTVYVEKGESMSNPAEPQREGYQISKWTDDAEGGKEISFPYTPTGDATIYAQWNAASYGVTFDYNMAGEEAHEVTKEYNSQITAEEVAAIEIPENSGYEFRYWTSKADSDVRVEWPYTVKKDVTFYAHWIEEGLTVFSITFDANYEGAPAASSVEVVEGDSLELRAAPADPERPGCKFLGWSLNKDATTKEETISFPYTPTASQADGKNISLYAVWEKSTYTIRYYYNYTGSPDRDLYKTETVLGGDMLEEPAAITRVQDGVTFEFDGWYTNTVGGTKIEFPTPATSSMSLFAHWKAPMTAAAAFDNKFDAEFTPIDPNVEYPGYSNAVKGTEMIQPDREQNSFSATYPVLDGSQATGHFVYCMYKKGAALTFNIYSSKAASNVTLYASLSLEMVTSDITMTPEGEYGFSFIVNGEALDYGSVTVKGGSNVNPGGGFMGTFSEVRIARVNLKEGWNTIVLQTNNSTSIGGVSQAWAPMIDYIRLDVGSKCELSWQPEYDNLYRSN